MGLQRIARYSELTLQRWKMEVWLQLHAQLGAVNRARAGNVRQLRSGGLLQYVQ